jgi:hypothetical protein
MTARDAAAIVLAAARMRRRLERERAALARRANRDRAAAELAIAPARTMGTFFRVHLSDCPGGGIAPSLRISGATSRRTE